MTLYRMDVSPLRHLIHAFLLLFLTACGAERTQELIIYGGPIVPMTENSLPMQAIYVRNGEIVEVGTKKQILSLANDDTRIIDLKGKTLMPGFISPHTHPDLSAYLYSFVDLSGFTNHSPNQVKAKLLEAIEKSAPGEWIFCKGFDPILVPGLEPFTLAELDEIAPNNPVFILAQSMHSAWANSAAFENLHIGPETKDPAPGSFYETENGKLTGFISEIEAIKPFSQAALENMDIKSNARRVMGDYSSHGITSIGTAGLFANDSKPLMMFRWLSVRNPGIFLKTLNFIGLLPDRGNSPRNFVYLKSDTPQLIPEKPDRNDEGFQIIGVKLWYDGSPYTASMYLSEPYIESDLMQKGLAVKPDTRGASVIDRQIFRDRLQKYHNQGWQLAIHSQGDQASREVVQELDATIVENPREDHRHRLEHCLLLPTDLIEKVGELGISPSFHINHLYYYGDALKSDIIGTKRASIMLPLHSVKKAGIRFTLHADQPMYPEDPLSLVATAVERKTRNGTEIGFEEGIDVRTAIQAVTINAAWQLGMEKKLGTIEIGKKADFVILSSNPLTSPVEGIRRIQVLQTIVDGEVTFGPN